MRHADGFFKRSPAHYVQASGRLDDYPEIVCLGDGVIDAGPVGPIDFRHRSGRGCVALAQGIREAKLLTLLDLKPPERLLPDCTEVTVSNKFEEDTIPKDQGAILVNSDSAAHGSPALAAAEDLEDSEIFQ